MSTVWRSDTTAILSDGGGVTATVKSATYVFKTGIQYESGTSNIWTGTVLIFTRRSMGTRGGGFAQKEIGWIAEATHDIYFPYTSTISVGNRVFESGETDYYEVLNIALFEDHKEIMAKKVENR